MPLTWLTKLAPKFRRKLVQKRERAGFVSPSKRSRTGFVRMPRRLRWS